MNVARWLWNPAHYWPYGLLTVAGLFIIRETWALASGRPPDTLSWWVWRSLGIMVGERPENWNAGAFLTFGLWILVVTWLTFHFWFRRFA